jgi:hypothetical protein
MAKRTTKKLPKQRNFYAMAVRDPSSPFRPKTIPNPREKVIPRKRKHKGRDDD